MAGSDDDDESDDDNEAPEAESDSGDSDVEVLDDSNGNGDGNTTTTANTPTPTHNVPKEKDVAKYLSKHINSLTTVPAGMDTKGRLDELKERPTAREAFLAAMDYPKQQVLDRYQKLELDGRPVETMDYAHDEQRAIITNALKQFDSDYNSSYSSKSQLKKMPQIAAFVNCSKHCRITEFTVEFRLCDKSDCDLCKCVGRKVRTPDVDVGGTNLRKELMCFMTLPIRNPDDTSHYLPPQDARRYIEQNNVTADESRKMIPNSKQNSKDRDWEEWRRKDKEHTWEATKVRETAKCKVCGANRCIFSKSAVGSKNGPTEEELKGLQLSIENDGYVCGDKIKGLGSKFTADER